MNTSSFQHKEIGQYTFKDCNVNLNWIERAYASNIDTISMYKSCISAELFGDLVISEDETPFLVRRMQGHLSGIPDAEGWYAGCHFWSKLDSDVMNWKVKICLEQKQSKFI